MTVRRIISATAILSCLVLSAVLPGQAETNPGAFDQLGAPGPLRFGGIEYRLVWTNKNRNIYFKQEYVPAGETVERYKSMVLLELRTGVSMNEAVGAQARKIVARKKTDPVANLALLTKENSEEVILDFVLQGKDAQGGIIVEWNGYRYVPYTGPSGEKGVFLFAISRRAYGDAESLAFLKALKDKRHEDLAALAQIAIPCVAPDGCK